MLTALVSFVGATLLGFALAWRDSWEYWTTTIRDTDRIGTATLNTNQNIAGTLARLGLTDGVHFAVWTVGCFAVLGLTVWATRRLLRAAGPTPDDYEPVLALICVALFGLVVSPVSWSHHWVWTLPTLVVTAVLAYRRRNVALAVVTAVGVALMVWTPITADARAPRDRGVAVAAACGRSYLWWAVAVILHRGPDRGRGPASARRRLRDPRPAAGPQQNPKPAVAPSLRWPRRCRRIPDRTAASVRRSPRR